MIALCYQRIKTMVEQQRKKIVTAHTIKCYKCGKFKTFPNFPFTGKGKKKKGSAGMYRNDICLACGGKAPKRTNY